MELNEFDAPDHENASVSLKVILLVFALVVVGALGYMVYVVNTSTDGTDYSTVFKKKTTTTATSSLNTYTSAKFGFTFKYPSSQVVTSKSTDSSIILAIGDDGHWINQIEITSNTGNKTIDTLTAEMVATYGNDKVTVSDVKLGSLAAKQLTIKEVGDYGGTTVTAVNGTNIITVSGDTTTVANAKTLADLITTFTFNN